MKCELSKEPLYLSFGAGVNSFALYLYLHSLGIEFEAVFSDPGREDPGTYRVVEGFVSGGYPVTVLHPIVEGTTNIADWCRKLGHGPFRAFRSCTDKWKHRPLEKYFKKPCIVFLGIAYDERHRARITRSKNGKFLYLYPLVDAGITRKDCVQIIKDAGLPVPPKSGCTICPFQSRASWWRLARQSPDRFWEAVEIDELSKKIGLYREPGRLRGLWPPQNVFEEDEGWECQHCLIV